MRIWLFQLTSSRRGWRSNIRRDPGSESISTHILTKRMTSFRADLSIRFVIFQLTSSRRGWPFPDQESQTPLYFNSHPHEEDDQQEFALMSMIRHFNSHPHEEDDESTCYDRCFLLYFNSHPHEEDDWIRLQGRWKNRYFNSHPHEEDDGIG